MKNILVAVASILACSNCFGQSPPIYDTLSLPKTYEFWSINFPILQGFVVNNDSKMSSITVGIPWKSNPGRQLSVLLYDKDHNLLKKYTNPSEYYYNVDHYYKFNSDDYDLVSGKYFFGVLSSNGPTGWIGTTGGMLGRIDQYCVPETSYLPYLITIALGGIAFFRWGIFKQNNTEEL